MANDQELDFTGTALEMASVYLAMTTKALKNIKDDENDVKKDIEKGSYEEGSYNHTFYKSTNEIRKTAYLEMINEAKHKVTEYVKVKLGIELPCDDSEIYDTRWNTEFTDAISKKLTDIRIEREKKINASS